MTTIGKIHDPVDSPHLDNSTPALIAKIGHYPLHHGGVGAIRSLGRLGVPIYAVTEDRWTPAALSRYVRERIVWPTTGLEDPAELVKGFVDIGRRIGRPSVLLPFDDETAVLISEHAAELAEYFLLPQIDARLPRKLASKRGLHDICGQHGVPSLPAYFPTDREQLERVAEEARFPLVAKNVEVFERKRAPVVGGTTRVDDARQLRSMADGWGDDFAVILQEYLPPEDSEDWMFSGYCDESSDLLVQFTGVKVRSSPPHAGMTSCSYSVSNPDLAEMVSRLVKDVGYCGPLDLDVRYDRRSGRYYLVDFNPRIGAQFRAFETAAGVDVVRAMYLHQTGRAVPPAEQLVGRRYIVETVDFRSALTSSRGYNVKDIVGRPESTELAWLTPDDLPPFLAVCTRLVLGKLRQVGQFMRGGRRMAGAARARSAPGSSAPVGDSAGRAPKADAARRPGL